MNDITEIKSKIAYVKNALQELEDELTELEVTDALNTAKESQARLEDNMYLGSIVNDVDDYPECKECDDNCMKGVVLTALMLVIIVIVAYSQ